MFVCDTEIKPGEKKRLAIPVPGVGVLEGCAVCGKTEGPTLTVTAGVHGCEFVGIEAARQLIGELNPEKMSGQVLVFPLINRSGFHHGLKQTTAGDRENVNRAFPGDENGGESLRIAAAVEKWIYPATDFLLDLHSGDSNELVIPFTFFPAYVDAETTRRARAASDALSLEYRVASSAKNGLYSYAALNGIPALLLERGGLGAWTAGEVEADKKNVCELMRHLGILTEEAFRERYAAAGADAPAQREITRTTYLEAEHDGFWYSRVKAGDRVKKGQLLGELADLWGNPLERYTAEYDGIVLYYTAYLGVRVGDPLIAYGEL